MRISKESIFTGIINFKVFSIDDTTYDESFGFTEQEVKQILHDYGMENHLSEIKKWYDGYHLGNADIYCPWDVINYISDLVNDPYKTPQAYWINSSGNDLVKLFVDKSDQTTREELEMLMEGKSVFKNIRTDLTYEEIDTSIDNMWSVLYTTGYLTCRKKADDVYELVIPNKEVRKVYALQILEWFHDIFLPKNNDIVSVITKGFLEGIIEDTEKYLTNILEESISILDTKARNEEKENFYHGFLIGILKGYKGWSVRSNVESGDGFADILLKPQKSRKGIVIEIKYARSFEDLDNACERALRQVKEKHYDKALREDGRNNILVYGIAFYRKTCRIKLQK